METWSKIDRDIRISVKQCLEQDTQPVSFLETIAEFLVVGTAWK